jgi:hypothetical protein
VTAPRFTRQVRLAEVGEAGQAKLSRAAVRVPASGLAAAVEARYLTGAGVAVVGDETAVAEPAPAWLGSLAPSAREVALGAHAALVTVRALLSGSDPPS